MAQKKKNASKKVNPKKLQQTVKISVLIGAVVILGAFLAIHFVLRDTSGEPAVDPWEGTDTTMTQKVESGLADAISFDEAGIPTYTPIEGWTPPLGLGFDILKEGDGPELTVEETFTANYALWLTDGTFREMSFGNSPFETTLQGVIPGWTQGLAGVKVGSTVVLVVPPYMGYGASDQTDQDGNVTLPGMSTLVFVVEILGVAGEDPTDTTATE